MNFSQRIVTRFLQHVVVFFPFVTYFSVLCTKSDSNLFSETRYLSTFFL